MKRIAPQSSPRETFEYLYSQAFPVVRSIAFRMCGNKDFEDVAQDSFLKIWEMRDREDLTKKANPKTWICRVAVNTAIDYLRKSKRTTEMTTEVPAENSNMDTKMENHQLVQKALLELSPEHRAVVVLHYFEDLNIQEIAATLGVFSGTVKSRLFHARELLLKILAQWEVKL